MRLELESKWTNVIHELLVVDFDPLLALIFFLFFFCVFYSCVRLFPRDVFLSSRFHHRIVDEEIFHGTTMCILKYRAGWAISSPRCVSVLYFEASK